ncbi:MAG: L,D-transpeptidase [Corynebacterium sp.]|nr:L,D-transpeptidase [Corynebacterium sp.]
MFISNNGGQLRLIKVFAAVALGAGLMAQAPHDAQADIRTDAWNTRQQVYAATENSPIPVRDFARGTTDNIVNFVAPGVIFEKEEEARIAAEEAARIAAEQEAERQRLEAERIAEEARLEAERNFDYGPCPKTAKACVDLKNNRAWLQQDGVKIYGPTKISHGAPGYNTATGDLPVLRKVKNEVSYIYNMAPMPYSVYFTANGMAFHQGSVEVLSHGCIHLDAEAAPTFFNHLNVGDRVYIY